MLILFAAARAFAAGLAINLPAGELPGDWAECLAIAGLVASSSTSGPRVEVVDEGERWRLRAQDGRGSTREVVVTRPRTAAAREDVAFLAASLVRPMAQHAGAAAALPAAPAPVTKSSAPPAPAARPPPDPPPPAAPSATVSPVPTAAAPVPALAAAVALPSPVAATSPAAALPPTAPVTSPPVPVTSPVAPAPVAVVPPTVTPSAVVAAPSDPLTPVASAVDVVEIAPPPATPEPAPAAWWFGLGAAGSASVRLDSVLGPALGGRFEAGRGDFGAAVQASWAAPAVVSALQAAPSVAETTISGGGTWQPGQATVGLRAGVALLAVTDASGDARGDLVAAPVVEAEGGWRLHPGGALAVEPFVALGVVTRKVSLLTVAEGKSPLDPWRIHAGVAFYFFAGKP